MKILSSFVFILLIEILSLFVCFFILLGEKITRYFLEKRTKIKEEALSSLILRILKRPSILSRETIPRGLRAPSLLIATLEAFDQRFKGDPWDTIKKTLMSKWVLPRARRWSSSFF